LTNPYPRAKLIEEHYKLTTIKANPLKIGDAKLWV